MLAPVALAKLERDSAGGASHAPSCSNGGSPQSLMAEQNGQLRQALAAHADAASAASEDLGTTLLQQRRCA